MALPVTLKKDILRLSHNRRPEINEVCQSKISFGFHYDAIFTRTYCKAK